MTIRRHLLILAAGAFVPLMLFAVGITSFSWWEQRNALELRYLERVRAMTIALDTEIGGAIRMLRALGLSPDIDAQAKDTFVERMQRALDAQPLWIAVAEGDPDWSHVVAAQREPGVAPLPAIDNATLARARANHLPAVSGLVRSARGRYETQIVVPMVKDGVVRNVLLAVVDQGAWLKFMSQYPIGTGATMTLVDQDGLTIASTGDNARSVGTPPPPALLEKSRAMLEGAYRGEGPGGVRS